MFSVRCHDIIFVGVKREPHVSGKCPRGGGPNKNIKRRGCLPLRPLTPTLSQRERETQIRFLSARERET